MTALLMHGSQLEHLGPAACTGCIEYETSLTLAVCVCVHCDPCTAMIRRAVYQLCLSLLQVAGTEQGITEPEATFSACFGGAFLLWHPMKYASMLAEKMDEHGTNAWLVNTGWTGGR